MFYFISNFYQIALLFGFMDLGYQLSISGSSHDALVNVALTFGITAGKNFNHFYHLPFTLSFLSFAFTF